MFVIGACIWGHPIASPSKEEVEYAWGARLGVMKEIEYFSK